jgi:hypothetical protein
VGNIVARSEEQGLLNIGITFGRFTKQILHICIYHLKEKKKKKNSIQNFSFGPATHAGMASLDK